MMSDPEPGKITGEIILCVDDSRDALAMLVDALEAAGFTVLAAKAGEAALDLVNRIMPHLIVMDAMMPGIDGFATCRRLKQQPRSAHVPVIFMTGLTDTEHVLKGLEAGGVDYVTKPVIVEELIARIRIHIANARIALGARVALDATGRYLLACDANGSPRWCTPQAASLLAARFPQREPGRITLPDAVMAQLAALIRRGACQQTSRIGGGDLPEISAGFLSESAPDEFLLRLTVPGQGSEEDLLRAALKLTAREAEVLLWIARAKSTNEIGEILAISPRTVMKHLERIFEKLGVENRAAATAVAMRLMAGRD